MQIEITKKEAGYLYSGLSWLKDHYEKEMKSKKITASKRNEIRKNIDEVEKLNDFMRSVYNRA